MGRRLLVRFLFGLLPMVVALGCDPDLTGKTCTDDRQCVDTEYCTAEGTCTACIWTTEGVDFTGWQRSEANPLIEPGFSGGSFDTNAIITGTVLYDEDEGNYKLWYTGMDADYRDRIGFATSDDGLTWIPYSSDPVIDYGFCGSFDTWHAHYPVVIKDGDGFRMWYSGDSWGQQHTCLATSTDGAHWVSEGRVIDWTAEIPGEDWARFMVPGTVIDDGDLYRMWYACISGDHPSIGYATSIDGVDWDIHGDVISSVDAGEWFNHSLYFPTVIRMDSQWFMFYSTVGAEVGTNSIGLATSEDGLHWSRHRANPVFETGATGAWDSNWTRSASVLLDRGRLRMWYSGVGLGSPESLGHAELDGPYLCGAPGELCDGENACQDGLGCVDGECTRCIFYDGFESSISSQWGCGCSWAPAEAYCSVDAEDNSTDSGFGTATTTAVAAFSGNGGVRITPEFGIGMEGPNTRVDLAAGDAISFDFRWNGTLGTSFLTIHQPAAADECYAGIDDIVFFLSGQASEGALHLVANTQWFGTATPIGLSIEADHWTHIDVLFDWTERQVTVAADGVAAEPFPMDPAFTELQRFVIGAAGSLAASYGPTVDFDNVCVADRP